MMNDNRLVRPQSVKDIRAFLNSEANVSVANKPANKKAKRNIAKIIPCVPFVISYKCDHFRIVCQIDQ